MTSTNSTVSSASTLSAEAFDALVASMREAAELIRVEVAPARDTSNDEINEAKARAGHAEWLAGC